MTSVWEPRFAQRTQRMRNSAIRELLKLTEQPDMISFSGGLPAPDVFPVERVRAATDKVLRELGATALQYGATEGYGPLREMIAADLAPDGVPLAVENVLVTTGSQQALDLIGKTLIDPGDRILVEAPTYVGAMQAWTSYGAEYILVPTDDEGLQPQALAAAFESRPKFVYVMPNFQNPSGVTLSLARRHQLLDLAARYGVPIIEDDPYGQLRFEGEALPSLLALAAERQAAPGAYRGLVTHLSTFSKTLAPGLRVAWVIAPPEVSRRLVQAKQGADLHSSTFAQIVAYEVAAGDLMADHVPLIRQAYRERRDVMLEAMAAAFPPGVAWTRPAGGMFLWVTLPEGVDAGEVLREAVKVRVAFVPGANFFPCGGGENTLRLNFSNASPDTIREGIARLGNVLHQALDARQAAPALAV